jgi:DNA-binding transcriptional LysR family regulator
MQPIMKVNLKLLQVFLLVAEHESFRSAADQAHRSQSSVSTQIKQLEGQLGVALFHRTTRSVRLTSEGAQLLDCVRRALREVEEGLRKIEEAVDMRRGQVSLGCSPTVAGSRLPIVLAAFRREYPDVKLFVRELTSGDLFESLRKREVDFGIGPVVEEGDLTFRSILREDIYALVPRRLFQTLRSGIALADLVRMPVLLLNPATALRGLIERTVAEQGLTLNTNYQFSQVQTLIAAASAGLGVAILPKIALPTILTDDLQILRITEPPMSREIAIITIRGQSLSPAAARLAALVSRLIDGKADAASPVRAAPRATARARSIVKAEQ